jgi:hypothetical protein
MAASTSKNAASDDGKDYVVVKTDAEVSPIATGTTPEGAGEANLKEEESKAPDILYKVQYKDYSGM